MRACRRVEYSRRTVAGNFCDPEESKCGCRVLYRSVAFKQVFEGLGCFSTRGTDNVRNLVSRERFKTGLVSRISSLKKKKKFHRRRWKLLVQNPVSQFRLDRKFRSSSVRTARRDRTKEASFLICAAGSSFPSWNLFRQALSRVTRTFFRVVNTKRNIFFLLLLISSR